MSWKPLSVTCHCQRFMIRYHQRRSCCWEKKEHKWNWTFTRAGSDVVSVHTGEAILVFGYFSFWSHSHQPKSNETNPAWKTKSWTDVFVWQGCDLVVTKRSTHYTRSCSFVHDNASTERDGEAVLHFNGRTEPTFPRRDNLWVVEYPHLEKNDCIFVSVSCLVCSQQKFHLLCDSNCVWLHLYLHICRPYSPWFNVLIH